MQTTTNKQATNKQQPQVANKQQQTQQTQTVTTEQPMQQFATLRARRLAMVQAAIMRMRVAARTQYQQARKAYLAHQQQLANQAAYQLAVQQLQAQYNIPATQAPAPRANSATVQPSPTVVTVNGVQYLPTKAVHALCELHQGNRKAVLAAAKQLGINNSTAATQYGVWRKNNPVQ